MCRLVCSDSDLDPKDNEDNYDYMIMMMMVMGVDDFGWWCSVSGWSSDDVDWDR